MGGCFAFPIDENPSRTNISQVSASTSIKDRTNISQVSSIKDRTNISQVSSIKDRTNISQVSASTSIRDIHITDQDEMLLDYIMSINKFIRTRSRFNSSDPYNYQIDIAQVIHATNEDCPPFINQGDRKQFILACGHFKNAGNGKIAVAHLTPMRKGKKGKYYGKYMCNCGRQWSSAHSWRDKYQKCQSCESPTYPYEQENLKVDYNSQGNQPHDMRRCEKCIELGTECWYSV
jgi:hypothetical protein